MAHGHGMFQTFLSFLFILLLIYSTEPRLYAQSRIVRGTFGSASGAPASDQSRTHGTISQTAVGTVRAETYHQAGFWPQALLPDAETVVSLPEFQAPIAHRITVPLRLESVDGVFSTEPRSYNAHIRYNATLLEPIGATQPCLRVGDTCFLQISGTSDMSVGTLVELEFLAKLGNDTATPLTIESFEWTRFGEERLRTLRVDGQFTLLGVCREGDSVRLVRSSASAARVSVRPNPAHSTTTAQFVAAESGPTEMILFDMMGKEIARLADFQSEADRVYHIELNLKEIPSGAYTLLCRTPSETMTERVMIAQ